MISFTILTTAPGDLHTFLMARGFLVETTNQDDSKTLRGAKPGVEFIKVPNRIVTALGNPATMTPPTYDARHCFLVKIAHEAHEDEIAGLAQTNTDGSRKLIWARTKLGVWIANNSSAFSVTDAAGKTYRGRKITGQPVWLLREDDAAQIAVWQ
jgi:hypothetical protein